MYYVYLLQDNNHSLYIGYSSDLKRRIREHISGKTFTTRKMIHPQLIYYEAYRDKISATVREHKLKQHGSAYQGLIKRLKLIK